MRKLLSFAVLFGAISIANAQTQQYEFIQGGGYVEEARNSKSSSDISAIRNVILADKTLSKEEKVRQLSKVGEIEIAKINAEAAVERNWIYAEAAVSAVIRGANLYLNKNPVSAGAIDSFAEEILQGHARGAIIKGCESGDWSGLEKVAQSVGAGAVFGAVTDLLGKIPIVKNTMQKVGDNVYNKVLKGFENNQAAFKGIKDKLQTCANMESDMWYELKSSLEPQLGKVQSEMADVYRRIANAETESEKNAIRQLLTPMEEDAALLRNCIAQKEAEIKAAEGLYTSLESEFRRAANQATENQVGTLDRSLQNLITGLSVYLPSGEKIDSISADFEKLCHLIDDGIVSVIDKATESIVSSSLDDMDAVYEREMQELLSSDGATVLKGGVSETVYIDERTGEVIPFDDVDMPANILNEAFGNTIGDVADPQAIANETFGDVVKKILEGNEDETLGQQIGDFVKGKIAEAIQKGEDWVEDGGIRKTIEAELDKMLTGKVSESDKQRILNLADKLCNVKDDDGKSLVGALGTDGMDLARSLSVNQFKKQLGDALPADVVDMINPLLDVYAQKGMPDDYKKAILEDIKKLVEKTVPYENSAHKINDILQSISDGHELDAMDAIGDLGTTIGIDALKDVLTKNLDSEVAKRVNALLDGYLENGTQGVTDEALAQINVLIDQYAPGTASAQQLKDIVKSTISGKVTAGDLKNTATTIVTDGAKKLIDQSNLPDEVKQVAKTAIDGLAENGVAGLTENVQNYINDYVTDKLGKEAGDAAAKIFDSIVTPGQDPWETIVANAPKIAESVVRKALTKVEEAVTKKIDALIKRNPTLEKVFQMCGINGAGIVQGAKNVFSVLWNASDLKDAVTKLADMAKNFLKQVAKNIIKWGIDKILGWINNKLIPKALTWASDTLGKWANSTNNSLIRNGLLLLRQQVSNCKKCATIRIDSGKISGNVVNWIESKTKNKGGATSTVIKTP